MNEEMKNEKSLKFVSMIPYIIISIILIEISVIMYDMFIKDNNVDTKLDKDEVTLLLSDTIGTTAIDGENIVVEISGENYGDLSCLSKNKRIAKCKIEGNKLFIIPQKESGVVNVEVTESAANKKVELQFTINEKENKNNFANNETPKTNNTIVSTINNTPSTTSALVTSLSLSGYIGVGYVNGNDVIIEVYGSNYGQLSCSSSDNLIATCKMNNNVLIVTPQSIVGTAFITIRENRQNKSIVFQINVKKEYDCSGGTLMDTGADTKICLTNGYLEYEEVCTNYYTTQTESNPICSDSDVTGVYLNETVVIGCTKEKYTDETYHCNNQHICIITEIKKTCTNLEYKPTYKCPDGFYAYSGSNENLKCYKNATLKK